MHKDFFNIFNFIFFKSFCQILKVYHFIRNTVITKLEQADVSESVTADIVGHEKKTITYGLYSGGSSMAQKIEAIEKIKL